MSPEPSQASRVKPPRWPPSTAQDSDSAQPEFEAATGRQRGEHEAGLTAIVRTRHVRNPPDVCLCSGENLV